MKYPKLVPLKYCRTDIEVHIEDEDISENGSKAVFKFVGKCNYQDSVRRIYTSDKTYVEITGVCLFDGDIFPDLASIPGGYVLIDKNKRKIYKGSKSRNPDGTVNYTRIDLV